MNTRLMFSGPRWFSVFVLDMDIDMRENVPSYIVFSSVCLCVALVHFEKFLKMN